MKKLIAFITMLIVVNHVGAESTGSGIISKVDLENGYIIVNMSRYKIGKGATEVFSGEHQLSLRQLEAGTMINFTSNDMFLTQIRFTTPLKFNR